MRSTARPRRPTVPRHRPGEMFIKGPIPWEWVCRAMVLGGRALAVAMFIWFQAGLQKRYPLTFCQGWFEEIGLNYQAGRRAIRALERARLIEVVRRPGCCLHITLLPAHTSSSADPPPANPTNSAASR